MRAVVSAFATLFLLTFSPSVVQAQAQPSADVVALAPDQLEWQETEEGFLMAILYGDPSSEGHYAIRFKLPPHWEGRPHTHGGAEIVTVYSGTMYFAYGEELSRDAAKSFQPGSFIALPAGTKMQAFAGDEELVVDVQGQGPFTTHYLDDKGDQGR